MTSINKQVLRRRIQLSIWPIVVITIGLGFWYPLIGFTVPLVMLMGFVGGIFKGRFVCAWLCPRGAFLDKIISKISPKKKVPKFLRTHQFRWSILAFMFTVMIWQISLDAGNVYHWGSVFVKMCAVTTAIAIVLAAIYHPRTWCSFCPMGTVQETLGKACKANCKI